MTINGLFYGLIGKEEEDLNACYLKLNIIYRYRNNGGSRNRCQVRERKCFVCCEKKWRVVENDLLILNS